MKVKMALFFVAVLGIFVLSGFSWGLLQWIVLIITFLALFVRPIVRPLKQIEMGYPKPKE